VLTGGDVGRALEHHVLEEVGEAGPARFFVAGSDVVPEVHRDRWRTVIGTGDHPQAVGQGALHDRIVERGRRGAHAPHLSTRLSEPTMVHDSEVG
jgi:hypothetical protein